MEEVLGGEFNEIHIFLTHKFPHFLDGTYDNENEVNICSFEDFLSFCKKTI